MASRFLKNMKSSCGIKSTISDEEISNPYHEGFKSTPPSGSSRASRVKSEERKGRSSSPSPPSGAKTPTGKPVSGAKGRSVSGANDRPTKAGGKKPASGW